ncbi:NADH-quinone oxidoreductase subunit K [Leptolyngbya ohadii]|uniref:NADH-quinone oxidoreductase subunit K n=1 Tax=Leptolyngbya ohadii TaxID=1962290 RepID=UPI0034E1D0BF
MNLGDASRFSSSTIEIWFSCVADAQTRMERDPPVAVARSGRAALSSSQNSSQVITRWKEGSSVVLEAFVFATILFGFFGIVFKKNLVMKIVSMDVMSTGVIAYYVLIAARQGLFTPIVSPEIEAGAFADPVPQAVILTAIVIGFSIQALMLVGVMKLSRDNPTLECDVIEKNNTP